MEIRVLTLRYSPSLGAIDDAPLVRLAREHEVLGVREHFFIVHDIPHLLCVVTCQSSTATSRAAVTTTTTAHAAVTATTPRPPPETPRSATDPTDELAPDQQRLFETIRRWRYETAQRDGVPPYVVLTNRNLTALLRERPATLAALGRIRGIGKATLERYGEALLAQLRGETSAAARTLVAVAGTPTSDEPAPSAEANITTAPEPEPKPEAVVDA